MALGVLEVIDPTGKPVAVGGDAEAALLRARHALEAGAHAAVLDEVLRLVTPSGGAHPRTIVEALTLAASASAAHGDFDGAVEHVCAALDHAAADGLWAPLLAYGARTVAILDHVAAVRQEYQTRALMLLDEVRKLESPAYIESLTQQEAVVLRYLPTLMSNAEIADAMHLSVNTVKTHLKALYRKLGVERRRDAVVRARQLELMS